MNARAQSVNGGFGSLAALKNVVTAYQVAMEIKNRPAGVDGLGVFFGPSGYGKSRASMFVQNKENAVYLEVFDFWTKKTFCEKLLTELGIDKPKGTIAKMMDQALIHLQDDPDRLLVIDEADKLVDKGMIELVRDLYKGSRCPVLLVGEERLPDKLAAYERCQNRVSAFGMAMPADLDDARKLAAVYQPNIRIADDLLQQIVERTKGNTSRIVATLQSVGQYAKQHAAVEIDAARYDGPIFTGQAPRRGGR
ncbi:AAA family ATPase [Rhizobium ruizarguesonis]|jgi:DNA transposition AAA+ family ATPase|uniref:AAA family ATPase n=1 Tax=Rhizobium TaxID=379 RepID=UPI0010322564|nr:MULTISPECIES: ATP-binding protein [Rhizobium]TCB17759.1 ATP-binding protein [Rhizobium leguminosarum bv. viciae]MBB4465475.1 DNA transposition AAA+ family ATPase [Rhizobium leguminosarum]MBB4472137.1 DNA transposition AAA+ family ATPase [Rhizobium leguminosarum]MBY5416920.1 ATP-binding protein [Rhizobium leguminosarum]QIO60474.1 ATP-binding protein [Rhizobium leguminosarum bv. trifolii]